MEISVTTLQILAISTREKIVCKKIQFTVQDLPAFDLDLDSEEADKYLARYGQEVRRPKRL